MNNVPAVSVIVPVRNGRSVLPACLEALEASDIDRSTWELIVVDDASLDGSGEWARNQGATVVRIEDGPVGPGEARNRGAEEARGDVLVFVDADVCVHSGVLGRFHRLLGGESDVGAAFGSYDDAPAEPSFVSQFRNLHHRYVHLRGSGPAETFWAGCGAVQRKVFDASGGFDAVRFPRPAVEDIELGYRIRKQGWEIRLDPSIQAKHLKRWTLLGMLRTDLFDRGIPWMRLLLEEPRPPSLNIRTVDRLRLGAVGLALVALGVGVVRGSGWFLACVAMTLVAVGLNRSLLRWFVQRKGWAFALRVIPLTLVMDLVSGMAVVMATAQHLVGRSAVGQ